MKISDFKSVWLVVSSESFELYKSKNVICLKNCNHNLIYLSFPICSFCWPESNIGFLWKVKSKDKTARIECMQTMSGGKSSSRFEIFVTEATH